MIVSLRKIININVKVKCYGYNDVVTLSVRKFSNDYFSSLTPLSLPMKEHNNIM